MLEKIIINNINSIKYVEIDFKKGSYKFGEDNIIDDYVNPIALYGHNGSGKTSIFNAISSLIKLMIDPNEALAPFIVNDFLYRKYFNNRNSKTRNENDIIGSISLFFVLQDKHYEYYKTGRQRNFRRIHGSCQSGGQLYRIAPVPVSGRYQCP